MAEINKRSSCSGLFIIGNSLWRTCQSDCSRVGGVALRRFIRKLMRSVCKLGVKSTVGIVAKIGHCQQIHGKCSLATAMAC
jgi:hypothetical protein